MFGKKAKKKDKGRGAVAGAAAGVEGDAAAGDGVAGSAAEQPYAETVNIVDGVYIPPTPENAVGAGAGNGSVYVGGIEGLTGKRVGIAAAVALAVALVSGAMIVNTVGFPAAGGGSEAEPAEEQVFEDRGIEAVPVAWASCGVDVTRCAAALTADDGSALYPVKIANNSDSDVVVRCTGWQSDGVEVEVSMECTVAAGTTKQTALMLPAGAAENAAGAIEVVDAETGKVVESVAASV